jgi:uncharacterized protein
MMRSYADVRETHTGVVFFAGDHAYKLKKPVELGFCDYRTRAARLAACARELELNRRLAPDVYLGLGSLGVAGEEGEPVVMMRRVPAEACLATLVRAEQGAAVEPQLVAVARTLAAFHERCHHGPRVAAEATRDAVRRRWEANLRETDRFRATVLSVVDVAGVEREAEEFLAGRDPLFASRIATDRVVDGHGDLLADDIFCLPDGPRILDCLEFDDRLRYVDRIDDVAFLAMDLERLGARAAADLLLERYREFSGDIAPASLVHHYVAYRAFVRAKVACIREEQGDPHALGDAQDLVVFARRHLEAGAARLILVGGAPGTGKSTLAGRIADDLGYTVLSSDRLRKEMAGIDPLSRADAEYQEGIYSPEHTQRVYAELCARAQTLLAMGESVVLDASWSSRLARGAAEAVAERTHSRLVALRCEAPVDLADARMAARRGPSDANAEVAAAMRRDTDPWPTAAVVDTSGQAHAVARLAINSIARIPVPRFRPSDSRFARLDGARGRR